jgi:hypothetical protein
MHHLPLIDRLARDGPTRFAHWDPALFHSYCDALLPDDTKVSSGTASAVAELLCEGIGRGYLTAGLEARPSNLMEHCFRGWLPSRFAAVPAEGQARFLADTWNLLEGLLREPAWVNAYVMARAAELPHEPSLQAFLARVLRPLFEPAARANWTGPFRVTTLSLRAADDEVLPGDMHLAAPTVLVVRDRRRDLACGVLLRKQGQSEVAGLFAESPPYVEESPGTPPSWQAEWVSLGQERIRLPFLGEPFRWLQVGAGFMVASAANSQKLWVVESDT